MAGVKKADDKMEMVEIGRNCVICDKPIEVARWIKDIGIKTEIDTCSRECAEKKAEREPIRFSKTTRCR